MHNSGRRRHRVDHIRDASRSAILICARVVVASGVRREPAARARQRARAGSRGKRPAGLPVEGRRDDPFFIDRRLTSWGQFASLAVFARKPTCPVSDRNAQMAASTRFGRSVGPLPALTLKRPFLAICRRLFTALPNFAGSAHRGIRSRLFSEPSPSLRALIRDVSWSRPWAWAGAGSASGTTRNQRPHPAEHRNVRMGRQIP